MGRLAMMQRCTYSTRRRTQGGAVAMLVALSLPVMLGVVAMALDLGRAYVIKAELQNAMDACALAASGPLSGAQDPKVFDVARAQALALIDPLIEGQVSRPAESINRVNFQSQTLDVNRLEVTFSGQIDGPFVAATSTQTQGLQPDLARYARCRYQDEPRALWMLPVLQVFGLAQAGPLEVSAQAVAALSPAQEVCAVPIAVCAVPGSTGAQNWGLIPGQRLSSVDDPATGYGSGNFGWADFTPPYGGASELSSLLEGQGACGIRTGSPVGQPGQANSVRRAWNTRFGLYPDASQARSAPPDYSGYGYAQGSGHLADYLQRRAEREPFQGQVGSGVVKLSSAQHASWGQSRRLVTVPVVDCSVWNSGNGSAQPQVLDMVCALLLAPVRVNNRPSGAGVSNSLDIEFLGLMGRPGAPCASTGAVGGVGGPAVPGLVQ